MYLSELLQGVPHSATLPELDIKHVTADSRLVEPGSLFVCLVGEQSDGHQYAALAVEHGASAVLCQQDLGLPCQILVENSRAAYALICANFYGNPARSLKLVGVTGTNGKTTVTYLIKHVLEAAGKQVGLIGTIQNEIGDMVLPARYTTPDPWLLHSMLARMVQAGCEYVVMECSSHALDQHRLDGCEFEAAAFTNLTQDHLDYHHDMEQYYQAKRKLFDMARCAVVNLDDETGVRIKSELSIPVHTFSVGNDHAEFTARDVKYSSSGCSFILVGTGSIDRVRLAMPGKFSVSNAMAAAACCIALGLESREVAQGLSSCTGVVGRAEVIAKEESYTIIRDYAHSPDGLEKIIAAVRDFATGRVVTLFGCAGNRDRTKRPKMAKIVGELSDFCILTSDNPRHEDPDIIIADALPGLVETGKPHHVEADRLKAIHWAIDHLQQDDVLLLCGKGHEDYQVLKNETIYFDEKVIVTEYLAQKKK